MSRILKWSAASVTCLAVLLLGFWYWGIHVPRVTLPTTGAVHHGSIQIADRPRSFSYYLPRRIDSDPPLLLVLHGSGMNGERMRALTGNAFDALADRNGFVVAYPDAYDGEWNDCRMMGASAPRRLGINDVAFLNELAAWFARNQHVRLDRVFVVGLSNGGQMAYRLGFETPDLVRGIAVLAANLPVLNRARCMRSTRPVAAMIINGMRDPINPYNGGEVRFLGLHKRGQVVSAMASARYFAALAGLHGAPTHSELFDTDPYDGTFARRWEWANSRGPQVVLIGVEGGGHTIPHTVITLPRILGRTSHDFSAADEIWKFFSQL